MFNNKGFFMPCIMAYTIIFFSFVLWQVTEVVDYQKLSLSFQQQVQMESAIYQATSYTKNIVNSNFDHNCLSPKLVTKNRETSAYTITYNAYCVREPGITQLGIPGDVTIIPAFAVINNSPSEVDELQMKEIKLAISTIVTTEMTYEWIGLPVDAIPTAIDAAQYALVLDMPCVLLMEVYIDTEYKDMEMVIKYNLRTSTFDKVIHT